MEKNGDVSKPTQGLLDFSSDQSLCTLSPSWFYSVGLAVQSTVKNSPSFEVRYTNGSYRPAGKAILEPPNKLVVLGFIS